MSDLKEPLEHESVFWARVCDCAGADRWVWESRSGRPGVSRAGLVFAVNGLVTVPLAYPVNMIDPDDASTHTNAEWLALIARRSAGLPDAS
jgi:hypothetical protein